MSHSIDDSMIETLVRERVHLTPDEFAECLQDSAFPDKRRADLDAHVRACALCREELRAVSQAIAECGFPAR